MPLFMAVKRILSIDRAGRVVLPKKIREHFHLHPGSQMEIAIGHDHLELKPLDHAPSLKQEGPLWVHQGQAQTALSSEIARTREERLRSVSRGM
jgi:AbrB family looped-hinge helix DNA binding protein